MKTETKSKYADWTLSAGHPAVAALPKRWRWGLILSLALICVLPPLLALYAQSPASKGLGTGRWVGAFISSLLIFRKAGLVRLPFIVAVIIVVAAAGVLTTVANR